MKGPQRGVAHWKVFPGCAVVFLLMFAGGCGPKVSPPDVVSEFEKAGPMKSEAEIAAAYGMTRPFCESFRRTCRFGFVRHTAVRMLSHIWSGSVRPGRLSCRLWAS